jgi:hypothetical protein
MQLANLLEETLDGRAEDVWENERTPTSVRRFGARLQSMGLSVRETETDLSEALNIESNAVPYVNSP